MNALNVTLGFILTTVAYAGASPACGTCGDKKCGHAPAQAEAKSAAREEPADAHGKETEKKAHAAGEAEHDHDGCDHAQEKPAAAAEAGHAHGAACDHGDADEHDAKPKTADKPEPEHAHGAECDHAEEKPAAAAEAGHAHGAACDHDSEAAKKPAASGDGHAHGGEACDGNHAAAAESACSHSEAGEAGAIELSESARTLLGISFVTAAKRPVTGTVRFPGRFEWMPGARRVYGAAVSGAVEVRVRPPQQVQAGDVLFTVRSPEWVAKKGEVNEAEAALALAKAEAEALRRRLAQLKAAATRNAELEQQLAVKEAETVRAERLRQNAEEALRAVRALCREADGVLVFTARDAGVVERVSVENGAWAETGAEVVCVTRADGLWFRADGVSSELSRVRAGLNGFVEPLGREPGEAARGQIELGLAADAAARIQPLYLLPQKLPAWALPGRAGVLSVIVEEGKPESLALPQACVVTDGLKSVVFVRDAHDADRFIKREVVTGANDGDWVEVKGLEAGATVVLDGAYELKLAAPSASAPKKTAGHFHADGQFHEGKH